MKTKILYRLAITAALTGMVFVACKKTDSTANSMTSSANLQTQSDDQTRVSDETDAVADDANTAMSEQSSVSGASVKPSLGYEQGKVIDGGGSDTLTMPNICDATVVVDSSSNPRTITITYNGNNCNVTRTRTGTVVISIPAGVHWRDQGAVVTLSIQNLKITRLIDNKSITLNGTHTYTNVSGGSLIDLPNLPNGITHTITSNDMSITFDNNAQRTWSVARQRLFTYSSGNISITTSGTHTADTTGISEWGTNRFGNTFETVILQPVVLQSDCNFRITNGKVQIRRPDVTTTVTFGLDATGNPTSCPGAGYYYFEAVWQLANKSYTFIGPY